MAENFLKIREVLLAPELVHLVADSCLEMTENVQVGKVAKGD